MVDVVLPQYTISSSGEPDVPKSRPGNVRPTPDLSVTVEEGTLGDQWYSQKFTSLSRKVKVLSPLL